MTARSVLHNSVMALLLAGLLAGCSEGPASPSSEDSLSVPEVSVVELQPAPLAVIRELPGRIAPTRIAEVRARVSGIVVNRNFEQGSDVKAGDVLYELDARPFEIDVDAAEAAFRKATAVLTQEKKNAKRMEMLAPVGPDVWALPCPRALDHTPPGDWTLAFKRDETGEVIGVTVGCWLARGLAYTRIV